MFIDIPVGPTNDDSVGGVTDAMAGGHFDSGYYRPYLEDDGVKCVQINVGTEWDNKKKKKVPIYEVIPVADLIANGISNPVLNATLALRKDEWIEMDMTVLTAARQRLRAWQDLVDANTFGGFDAFSKMVLEHETMSDPGEAVVDMDGLTPGRTDTPKFQLEGLPLPITHSDFWFSSRRLANSRNMGMPLDLTQGEASGRRVAESIEKTTIGIDTGLALEGSAGTTYGRANQVFGYTNFPDRNTKTDVTAAATSTGDTLLDEIATDATSMMALLEADNHFGPYILYVSSSYDQVMRGDHKAESDKTIRSRILEIEQISAIRRLDFLTGDVLILVQMTGSVARAINGMDIRVVQWESSGGMRLNFKVMAIQVPQLRADFTGKCGICHGTTA